ncbi:MAG: hypothetical protein KAS04_01435 [Candidatus Aenigmarchaeota archaeon]|nr:hypothetical protein [Candidatus Aenigmarchaeota archaeon]
MSGKKYFINGSDITEMGMCQGLIGHMDNPCAVYDGGPNIRYKYIKFAKEWLEPGKLEDPAAKKMLQDALSKYTDEKKEKS